MKSKSERNVAWCLIACVFALLAVAGVAVADTNATAMIDTTGGVIGGLDDAQPVAVANERSILHRTTDPANCPSGNCGRFGSQAPPPNQPQAAAPPQFNFDEPEKPAGVPVGLAVGLPIGCAVIGLGIGVAAQWRKTHTGYVRRS